jgi:nucleoid-associated protein YgaU
MGSVERVLVLGIVVVIVAILGIAVWGATGDDAGSLARAAADGGVALSDGPANSGALKLASKDAGAAAIAEIDRWREAREALRKQNKQREAGAGGNVPLKNDLPLGKPPVIKPSLEPEPLRTTPETSSNRKPKLPIKPTTVPPPPKSQAIIKHTVESGENLWKITFEYFGDSNIQQNLNRIIAANPSLDEDATLHIGTVIIIPKRTAAIVSPVTPKADFSGEFYEVQPGDTLSEISMRLLGTSRRQSEIYELNRDRMTAPDVLQVGMSLKLPKR